MRIRTVIVLLAIVATACGSGDGFGGGTSSTSDINVDAAGNSRLRPPDHVGTWVAPPNIEEALHGTWTGSTTLSLAEDGTYRFESLLGFDEGEYRVRPKAQVLRLATIAGVGFCGAGDVNRLEFTIETHPSGEAERLGFEHRIHRCGRPEFPSHLDRQGLAETGDFVGEWTQVAVFKISPDGHYELTTDLGADEGTFEYDDETGRMTLVTEKGDLCADGSIAELSVSTWVNPPVGSLAVTVRDDECYERSGMTQWMTRTGE